MTIQRRNSSPVVKPNLGVYLDRPFIDIPRRGAIVVDNFRIKNGRIIRENMGYDKFTAVNLGGALTMIDGFFLRNNTQFLIFGTPKNLFKYNEGTDTVSYLNPIYATGTVSVTNGSAIVTGSGTTWTTNAKAGDEFHLGSATQNDPTATWYEIQSVDSNTQVTLTTNYAEPTLSRSSADIDGMLLTTV